MKSKLVLCVALLAISMLSLGPVPKGRADEGWTPAAESPNETLRVLYKVDDKSLKLKFVNTHKSKSVDIHYQARWEENYLGKWEAKSTAFNAHVHVNKRSENHVILEIYGDKDTTRRVKVDLIDYKFN